jgi:carbon monoxide dehydrogenase subunit G
VEPVIDYRKSFTFDIDPAGLWSVIEQTERFEAWWPWLTELTLDGAGLVAGGVMRGTVSPPLPYRMRVEVDLLRCERPNEIDAAVHGDLEGTATLRLHEAGGGTRADVAWRLEMMQRPMRVASRFAHPLLRLGHDAVVDVTVASFRRMLRKARAG